MSGTGRVASVTVSGRVCVVRLEGEVDVDSGPEVEEALSRAWRSPTDETRVELAGLVFADSTLLNLLLGLWRRHRKEARALTIAGPFTPAVRRLFEVTGTAGHLPLTEPHTP
ncbi:STAS domain-containing protein [Streptomyces sp. NPDC050560]|uniref:STAS domain-containing protein n=1 Tax=Streptomyces sp. NPDC050560 TaxID=3365630 RepID=UPI00378E63AA